MGGTGDLTLAGAPPHTVVEATARSSYGWIAGAYEPLAALYSGGGIPRSKRAQLEWFPAHAEVLIAGAGAGEDALLAAERGARLTLVDTSARMLDSCRARLAARGHGEARFVHANVLAQPAAGDVDLVIANYFLNVFAPADMRAVVAHLARMLRPTGQLLIADFAPAVSPALTGALQRLYFALPLLFFSATARNPWHGLYDYAPAIAAAGLRLIERRRVPIFGGGPAWLEVLRASRDGTVSTP